MPTTRRAAVTVGAHVLYRCPQLRIWVGAHVQSINADGTLTLRDAYGARCVVTVAARKVRLAALQPLA